MVFPFKVQVVVTLDGFRSRDVMPKDSLLVITGLPISCCFTCGLADVSGVAEVALFSSAASTI
jgi:hypothetical protein